MPALHYYRWNATTDSIWHVCAFHLDLAGLPDLPRFVERVRQANPRIDDWQAVPDQTLIILPLLT